ncbi:MAG: 3'-5' exonuclease [Porphyromonadaceae bacterium CG2_30_38_12]|nr:MAG: 3'-5' exonuclease [Porphyromonadaceae bacterium CG2_30_38_12]
MYLSKISKEEVNQLPIVVYEGKITIIDELSKVSEAIDELRKSVFVGIDTETKPSFTRGIHHKISLVQLSTFEHSFLFRINKIGFPPALAHLLSDDKIMKIGLALRDDFAGLNRWEKFKPDNYIDIQTIAKEYGILELGLQKIFAIVFQRKISKSQQLTNWENNTLTEQQQRYAATDAWACLLLYMQLLREDKLSKKQVDKLVADANAAQIAYQQAMTLQRQTQE